MVAYLSLSSSHNISQASLRSPMVLANIILTALDAGKDELGSQLASWGIIIVVIRLPNSPVIPSFSSAMKSVSTFSDPTFCFASKRTTAAETVAAIAEMSIDSTGSASTCHVAMSPTSTQTGLRALRALCKFAIPLARPGPRCNSTAAGRRDILAKPSAAPVAVFSCRHRMGRILPWRLSRAAQRCISVVPGLAKQMLIPVSEREERRASAPVYFPSIFPVSWASSCKYKSCEDIPIDRIGI